MEDFHSPSFNSYNKGFGKEIRDSADGDKNFHLYVIGIPPDFTPRGLINLYSECGVVQKCNLLSPKQPGWPKAGFIEYKTMPEVLKALELYKEFPVGKYTIKTSIAKKHVKSGPKFTEESIKDLDLGELVEESIQQTAKRAEKRFGKFKEKRMRKQEDQEKSLKSCAVCNKPCLSTCGQCKIVSYCGSTCQRDDWTEHKKVCVPIGQQNVSNLSPKSLSGNEASDSSDNLMIEVDSEIIKSVESHVKSLDKSSKSVSEINDTMAQIPLYPSCVSVGGTITVILVDVQIGTGMFYFQISDKNDSLQALDHKINQHYSQSDNKKAKMVQPGQSYACQFSMDQKWYRVIVQNIDDNSVCNIWYVDYGNCEDVPVDKLMELEPEYLTPEPHSFRAKLHGCDDIEATNVTQVIGEQLRNPNVELLVKNLEGTYAEVEVFFDDSGVKASLNKILIEKYLPNLHVMESTNDSALTSKNTEMVLEKKETEIIVQNPAVLSPPSKSEEPVCVLVEEPKSVTKMSPKITKSNLSSIFQKIRIKPEIFDENIKDAEIPDGKFDAVITHAENIENISIIKYQEDVLEKLHNDLSEHCEKNYISQPFMEGKICAAKSSTGDGWYRAEMLSKCDPKHVFVKFFDFGNRENVAQEQICQMPKEEKYWKLEKQALNCLLKDCLIGNDSFNEKSLELLKQCENQVITVEMDKSSGTKPLPVTIYIDESSTVNDYLCQLKSEMDVEKILPEKITCQSIKEADDVIKESEEKAPSSILDSVQKGSDVEILITYVESPGNFVCQIFGEKNQIEMNDLTQKMFQYYENSSVKDFEISTKNLYAVKYHIDSMWYRAKIVNDTSSDGIYDVVFLDYGNCEKVSKSMIKPLMSEFQILSLQGIKCKLGGCFPDENGNWTEDSITGMKNLCNQKFAAKFLNVVNGEAIIDVFFDNQCSVAVELIAAGLVADSDTTQSIKIASNSKLDVTAISEAQNATSITEDNRVDANHSTDAKRASFDTDIPPLDDVLSSEPNSESINGSASISIDVVQPILGETQRGGIVHANDPGSFYCQLFSGSLQKIVETLEKLNVKCTQEGEPKLTFEIGDICVACASDGRWYRSQILNVDDDNKNCLVHFLDYGDDDTVSFEKIQSLSSEFASVKVQAMHCKLANCYPIGEQWNAEAVNIIKTLTDQVCQIKFLTNGNGVFVVDVYLTEEMTLTDYLIQNGFAAFEKNIEDKKTADEEQKDKLEDNDPKFIQVDVKAEDVSDDVKQNLAKGDLVSIRIHKATSPHDMIVKVLQGNDSVCSVRMKLTDVEPIDGNWTEESSKILMMFATHTLEAKIVDVENRKEGNVYLAKVPTFVNSLVLAGLALYCM